MVSTGINVVSGRGEECVSTGSSSPSYSAITSILEFLSSAAKVKSESAKAEKQTAPPFPWPLPLPTSIPRTKSQRPLTMTPPSWDFIPWALEFIPISKTTRTSTTKKQFIILLRYKTRTLLVSLLLITSLPLRQKIVPIWWRWKIQWCSRRRNMSPPTPWMIRTLIKNLENKGKNHQCDFEISSG